MKRVFLLLILLCSMGMVVGQVLPQYAVKPLLQTIRVQTAPYNSSCPYYNYGDSVSSEPCVVGCVATALEQLLSYYRYPECLMDSLAGWETEHYSIATVPAGSRIDWEDVADLSLWCGMMVRMNYGPTSSAAGLWRAEESLRRVFGYKTVHVLDRSMYSFDSWHRILQNELMAGRPVAYVGYNNMLSGHAFNIDGVNEDGLYHCNWGEGEKDNGYFTLEQLCQKQPHWDETDWGRMFGYNANEYMLLLHPDSVTDVLLPDTLADFAHAVRVDEIAFRREITARDYVLTDVTLTNMTADTLFHTYELIVNLPTDTNIVEQCKEVCLSSVKLMPYERRTQVVAGRYDMPVGEAVVRITFDGEEFPMAKEVQIHSTKVDVLSVKELSVEYPERTTASIQLQITNTASEGTSGKLVYCRLYEEGEEKSISTDYRVMNLDAQTSMIDTITFHRLKPGKSYQLNVGDWSRPITVVHFSVPMEQTGIEDVIIDDLNEINNCQQWYDMSGKRTLRPEKGLYIKNGKKVYYEGRRDN